jgi:hypothetical protein
MPTLDTSAYRNIPSGGNASYPNMLSDPPAGIVAIDALKSNSVDLTKPIRGFMVTVAGTVKVTMADGTSGTYPGCAVGSVYPGLIARVWSTGTEATGIVGFY